MGLSAAPPRAAKFPPPAGRMPRSQHPGNDPRGDVSMSPPPSPTPKFVALISLGIAVGAASCAKNPAGPPAPGGGDVNKTVAAAPAPSPKKDSKAVAASGSASPGPS